VGFLTPACPLAGAELEHF